MVTKKTVKPATKKAPVKKTVAKKVAEPVTHECQCGHNCTCGHECHCGCHGHFLKKVIILLFVFALGCVSAHYFYKPHHKMNAMQPKFDNGCLVMNSVKCPQMQKALATADTDANGCISRKEFFAVKKSLHKTKMRK